jgi:hypothetical protein
LSGIFFPFAERTWRIGCIWNVGDAIYVFDNNDPGRRRLAVYDADGRMSHSFPLPGDLTANADCIPAEQPKPL